MSSSQPDPSDLLATTAAALHTIECGAGPDDDELKAWLKHALIDRILDDDAEYGDESELTVAELYREPALSTVPSASSVPNSYGEFLSTLRAIKALDRWHEPILNPHSRRLADHEAAELRLIVSHRMNSNADGAVAPALSRREPGSWAPDDPVETGRPLILKHVLEFTSYFPAQMVARETETSAVRSVGLRYRSGVSLANGIMPPTGPGVAVAIAPLVEAAADIELELVRRPGAYAVRPASNRARLADVVGRAVEAEIDLLFIPELALGEDDIVYLGDCMLDAKRAFYRSRSRDARLRYVFAGVAGEPVSSGERARNFVVALNGEGERIYSQSKLFRWDMTPDQCARFGLVNSVCATDNLIEDIDEGEEIIVQDLPDIGRLFVMICADAAASAPGDWLLQAGRLDWVYMPIMDQSTCWTFTSHRGGPWIAQRALRAALGGTARIVVANSVSLTHHSNERSRLNGGRLFSAGGIGLLLDPALPEPLCEHVVTQLDASDVLEVREWAAGWKPASALFGPSRVPTP